LVFERSTLCGLLFASLIASGCGDNIEGVELHDLDAAMHAAGCERLLRCGLFRELDTCIDYFRNSVDASLEAAVDAGKIHFYPTAAAICLRDLAGRSCDVTAPDARELPASCERMLVGRIVAGGTCVDDRECATGRCDAPTCVRNTCCVGACEPYVAPVAVGEACGAAQPCVTAAYCSRDGTCHALSDAGKPCDSDTSCVAGLACIGATELDTGTCRALPRVGEPCPYQRCAEIGAHCANGTCAQFALDGEACTGDGDCSEFRFCDASNRCVPIPSLGEPCTRRGGGAAGGDPDVTGGTCRPPQPNAVPCTANDQCASEFCEEGPIFDQCAATAVCF
jgi:hypothetical protein